MGYDGVIVRQASDIQGEVVAVEEHRRNTRITLQDAAERKYVLEVSRPLAEQIKSKIGDFVRCHGNGTWKRTDKGWKLKKYQVEDYTLLRRTMASTADHELRGTRLQ